MPAQSRRPCRGGFQTRPRSFLSESPSPQPPVPWSLVPHPSPALLPVFLLPRRHQPNQPAQRGVFQSQRQSQCCENCSRHFRESDEPVHGRPPLSESAGLGAARPTRARVALASPHKDGLGRKKLLLRRSAHFVAARTRCGKSHSQNSSGCAGPAQTHRPGSPPPAYGRPGGPGRAGAPLSMYPRIIFCCSGVRIAFAASIASR